MNIATLKKIDEAIGWTLSLFPPRKELPEQFEATRILVIKLSAMGDALCLMPAVRVLAEALPASEIDWLTTNRSNPDLFKRLPFLSRVITLDTSIFGLVTSFLPLLFRIKKYHLVVDFDQYYRISEILSRLGRVSAGFDAPLKGKTFTIKKPYREQLNEKYQFLELVHLVVDRLGVLPGIYRTALQEILTGYQPDESLRELAKGLRERQTEVLVIYPGSGKGASFRRWSWDRFEMVIERFQDCTTVLIAGGQDELDIQALTEQRRLRVINCINSLSLQDWLWLLSQIRPIVIGNDGGFLHIAEAAGIPSIGIFGPSRFSKWGSINPDSIGLEVELDCRPCLKNYLGEVPEKCWRGTRQCLKDIQPSAVIKVVDKVIKEKESSSRQVGEI